MIPTARNSARMWDVFAARHWDSTIDTCERDLSWTLAPHITMESGTFCRLRYWCDQRRTASARLLLRSSLSAQTDPCNCGFCGGFGGRWSGDRHRKARAVSRRIPFIIAQCCELRAPSSVSMNWLCGTTHFAQVLVEAFLRIAYCCAPHTSPMWVAT